MAFIKVGTLLCETISITNGGYATATNTTVTFTIPTGMVVENATPTKGTFSKVTGIWSVGTVAYKETPSIYLCLRVTDDSQPLYKLTWVVASDECDIDESNNTGEIIFDVFSCTAVQDCVDINLDIKMESFTITDEDGRLDTIFPSDTEVDLDPSLHMGPSGHIAAEFMGVSAQASSQGDMAGITTAHDNVIQGSTGSTISTSDRTGIYSGSTINVVSGTNVLATGTNYIANTIDNSLLAYKHVGTPLTVGTINASILNGLTHAAIDGVDNSIITGSGHDIGSMTDSLIVGDGNTLITSAVDSVILGAGNTGTNISRVLLNGDVVNVTTATDSIISVDSGTLSNINESLIIGGAHFADSVLDSVIGGFGHNMNSGTINYTGVFGNAHRLSVPVTSSLVYGQDTFMTSGSVTHSLLGGHDHTHAGIIGYSAIHGRDHHIDGTIDYSIVGGRGLRVDVAADIDNSIIMSRNLGWDIDGTVEGSILLGGDSITANQVAATGIILRSIALGEDLTINASCENSVVLANGGDSQIAGLSGSFYGGSANDVGTGATVNNSVVSGTGHTFSDNILASIFTGDTHTIITTVDSKNNIIGGSNLLTYITDTNTIEGSLIVGDQHKIRGVLSNSVVAGIDVDFNDASADVANSFIAAGGGRGLVSTTRIKGTVSESLIVASGMYVETTSTVQDSLLMGFGNGVYSTVDNSVIAGGNTQYVGSIDSSLGFVISTTNVNQAVSSSILMGEHGANINGAITNSIVSTKVSSAISGALVDTFLMGESATSTGAIDSFGFGDTVTLNHNNAVVFSDSNGLASDSVDRFHAKFAQGYVLYTDAGVAGGAGTTGATMLAGLSAWSAVSSEQYKDNFEGVNYKEMLNRFDKVDISKWTYKDHDTKHIGITAEDFYSITGKDIANEPDRISTTNSDGAIMAIMKGMYEEIKQLKKELNEYKTQNG